MTRKVVLASASPSRLAVLRGAGLDPVVQMSGVVETPRYRESPPQLATHLAHAKAAAVAVGLNEGIVIGCDSVLEFENRVYGKPATPDQAVQLWQSIAGRSGIFHTGHAVIDTGSGRSASALGSTVVHFCHVTEEEISAYVATREPLGVAGAFTIDGRGGWFVERLEGDHGVLRGLSLPLLRGLLASLDVKVMDLWT